jgi:hypothetical protein
MFFQGHHTGKKYGNKQYLKTTYPDLNHSELQNVVNNKATTIQSLFMRNRFRTYNKPILKDRVNAKMVEKQKQLPTNILSSFFSY